MFQVPGAAGGHDQMLGNVEVHLRRNVVLPHEISAHAVSGESSFHVGWQ